MTLTFDFSPFLFVPAIGFSFALCIVVIIFGSNASITPKQKLHWIHKRRTLRLGGVAIAVSLIAQLAFYQDVWSLIWFSVLASCLPLFVTGFLEDIGVDIRPTIRLGSGLATAGLAVLLTCTWLLETKIPLFDEAMKFPMFAIGVTIILSLALTQSYNLVDGLNGLSSGIGMISMALILLLAYKYNDIELSLFLSITFGTILGFWIINISTGRLFLGDSGAYLIGHLAGWCSILIVARHPNISPWALFLGTAYPVSDTIITIVRRLRAGASITKPDQAHLHHKIKHYLEDRYGVHPDRSNSLSSLAILFPCALAMGVAYTNATSSITCAASTFAFFLITTFASVWLPTSEQ